MSRNRRVWLGLAVALLAVVLVAAGAMAGSGKERFQWIAVDKLTVLEGGATFNSATTFADTVSFSSTNLDLDGNSLVLDSDADSTLTADTDDQLDLALGGADIVVFNEFGAASIVAGKTEHLVEIIDSTPVITGGTVVLTGLNVDLGIGNSTGGTNSIYGILIDGITQDAQNTETGLAIANGWDRGIDLDGNSLYMDNDQDSYFSELADDSIGFTPGAASGSFEVRTGNLQVGDGTPGETHNGEDFYVEGISEFDGNAYFDGAVDMDSTLSVNADLTIEPESTGGNAGAKNEVIGLPRITMVGLAAGTNGTTETVAYIDTTPAGEWAEVDGGTNIVVTADTSIYRHTTNSVKIAFTAVITDEGVDGTIVQDDLQNNESIGFWIYSTEALSSGDFDVTLDDTNGTDQSYNVPSVSANVWTWVELDISGCNANCDTTDGIHFLATGQGAAALTSPDVYLDGMYKWDSTDEEALGVALVQDGVISIAAVLTGQGEANTQSVLAEYTDYFTHYESGNDFVVWISDQSANSNLALVAY